MTTKLRNVTFDCSDARSVADFWSALTGWNVYTASIHQCGDVR